MTFDSSTRPSTSRSPIPLSRPMTDEAEREAVLRVLDSGRFVNGPEVRAFEEEFAAWAGVKYAVSLNSCTSAEQLALSALGIGPGDQVLVPSLTAFPTIEPIYHVGAEPVFTEVDEFCCMDPDDAEAKVTERTKALIPVHLYGRPASMERLLDLAKHRNLALVEDCAQAHGAEYAGRRVGSLGRIGCFSFYPSKNMTVAGDGGMAVTDDPDLARTMRMLRNHGRETRYEHELCGFNLRLGEMAAAVGRAQLAKLDGFVANRRKAAALYARHLGPVAERFDLKLPEEKPDGMHAYHLYVIRCGDRDGLRAFLADRLIGSDVHYPIPGHLQPAVTGGKAPVSLPVTERICGRILSLPMHPGLTSEEIQEVCRAVTEFMESK